MSTRNVRNKRFISALLLILFFLISIFTNLQSAYATQIVPEVKSGEWEKVQTNQEVGTYYSRKNRGGWVEWFYPAKQSYAVFNNTILNLIEKANEKDEVIVYAERWISLRKDIYQKLEQKPSLRIRVYYMYDGRLQMVSFSGATKISEFMSNGENFAGFEFVKMITETVALNSASKRKGIRTDGINNKNTDQLKEEIKGLFKEVALKYPDVTETGIIYTPQEMEQNAALVNEISKVAVLDNINGQSAAQNNNVSGFVFQKRTPLYAGYYRTWHDRATDGYGEGNEPLHNYGGKNSMAEIPEEVDIVFVFANYTPDDSQFWVTLKNSYVPTLHSRGTAVIRTISVRELFGFGEAAKELFGIEATNARDIGLEAKAKGIAGNMTNEQINQLAEKIIEKFVTAYGLDGIDIDIEEMDMPGATLNNFTGAGNPTFNPGECNALVEQGKKVLKAIHDKLDSEKLFIIDTTIEAPKNELFKAVSSDVDYVFFQMYGASRTFGTENINTGKYDRYGNPVKMGTKDDVWNGFAPYIDSKQFLIGFSFYEENGDAASNIWSDTVLSRDIMDGGSVAVDNNGIKKEKLKYPGTPTNSRAYDYALWQPAGGLKGGIFCYAIDRDGIIEGKGSNISDGWNMAQAFGCTVHTSQEQLNQYRWGDNTKHYGTTYEWSKSLKHTMTESGDYNTVGENEIEDPAFRSYLKNVLHIDSITAMNLYNRPLEIKDDANIVSLKGLENFINIPSLKIENLPSVKSITEENLPDKLKYERKSPFENSLDRIMINNMSGLENLSLKGFNLENLPLGDISTFTALTDVDISENAIDFSLGESRTKLSALKAKCTVSFDKQRPFAYPTEKYVFEVAQASENVNVNLFAFGALTKNGTKVGMGESGFNAYKDMVIEGVKFIDDGYTYAEFFKEYQNSCSRPYKYRVTTSTGFEVTGSIDMAQNESYNVVVLDEENVQTLSNPRYEDKEVYSFVIQVGDEREVLNNLTAGKADIIKATIDSSGIQDGNRAFDGNDDKATGYPARGFNAKGYIIFDLKESKTAKKWKFYNVSGFFGSNSKYVKNADLYCYKGADVPTDFDEGSSDWEKVGGFTDLIDDFYYADIQGDVSSRYWCFNVTNTATVQGTSVITVPELELLGK